MFCNLKSAVESKNITGMKETKSEQITVPKKN